MNVQIAELVNLTETKLNPKNVRVRDQKYKPNAVLSHMRTLKQLLIPENRL